MSVLNSIDVKGFCQEIEQLKHKAYSSLSEKDFKHMRKIARWGRLATLCGYLTAWIIPNLFSAFALSLGQFTRWLLAHHILHKGYDRVPGVPLRYTSKYFARGKRRFIDWFDWLEPSAWDYEHNILHHYNTGEKADPDLVEKHIQFLLKLRVPKIAKYLILVLVAMTWKFTYYAPNTVSVIDPRNKKRVPKDHIVFITIKNIFDFRRAHVRRLWLHGYLPYACINFLIVPLLFFPLGQQAMLYVFINKIFAEIITNIHSFIVIGPNHTADDLYRFEFHYKNKEEFYVTQVLSSANYTCGNDFIDYLSIWLNYQIEHHIFPDLPMSKYQEIQPRVKELCLKYNIPYRQEPMFRRFKRMIDVCVGNTTLRKLETFSSSELKEESSFDNASKESIPPCVIHDPI
jgi:fatty acid desaturase